MPRARIERPSGALATTIQHRVAFYETDAMGIVHHSNYVRFLELARVAWMDVHDRPYTEYAAEGYHIATTAIALQYHQPARFDDRLDVTVWLHEATGARLRMGYDLRRGNDPIASGTTDHAFIDGDGRPRRIPKTSRFRRS